MSRRRQKPRIDNYKGPKYTDYLENLVNKLRGKVSRLESQLRNSRRQLEPAFSAPIQQLWTPVQHQPLTQLCRQFVFEIETPKSQAVKLSSELSKPNEPSKSNEPKTALSAFLSQIPRDEAGWSARRADVNLCTQEELVQTFYLLTRLSPQSCSFNAGDKAEDTDSIPKIVNDYGTFAQALGAHKIYATQISNYSTVLFICLTIVAYEAGMKLESVNESTKSFLKKQQGTCVADRKHLKRLRNAASWLARQSIELYRKGLMHRAWEIFVLSMIFNNTVARKLK